MGIATRAIGAKEILKERERSYGKITAIITEMYTLDLGEITQNMVWENINPCSAPSIRVITTWGLDRDMVASFTPMDMLGMVFGTMIFHKIWIEH